MDLQNISKSYQWMNKLIRQTSQMKELEPSLYQDESVLYYLLYIRYICFIYLSLHSQIFIKRRRKEKIL